MKLHYGDAHCRLLAMFLCYYAPRPLYMSFAGLRYDAISRSAINTYAAVCLAADALISSLAMLRRAALMKLLRIYELLHTSTNAFSRYLLASAFPAVLSIFIFRAMPLASSSASRVPVTRQQR